MFTVYSENDTDSTLVSNLFIDEYMCGANDAQIKIYLYLIRMMSARRATSIADMADKFNHTEKEVCRSLEYWEKQGLLSLEYDAYGKLRGIHLSDLKEKAAQAGDRVISITPMLSARARLAQSIPQDKLHAQVPQSPAAAQDAAETVPAKRTLSKDDLASFCGDARRKQLLFIIEQYIGKPLSPREIQTIYYISEDLRFSDDLIDYLLQYCVDRGKKDFRYIEKVAVNWAQEGITTPKQAERALQSAAAKGTIPRRGRKADAGSFTRIARNHYDFNMLEEEVLDNQS